MLLGGRGKRLSEMTGTYPNDLDQLAELVTEWRKDAALFVSDQFGVTPTPQQMAMLKAASKPGARVAVKSGHGTGKSTTLAWLVLWGVCCFDDIKIPCTAPTGHQLSDILWTEVEKWRSKMLDPWQSSVRVTQDTVKVVGLSGLAVARTGRKDNPEALQGFHADELIFLIDEASGIPDPVFEVARGALSTPTARVVMAANPTRTTGYFYQAFHRGRDSWTRLTFSCIDSPLVSPNYVEEMRQEYGEDSDIYKVRVLGEFPSGGDLQFIPAAVVTAAQRRYYRPELYSFAPVVLGVDVAWFGGDKSVIFLRQGLYSRLLFATPNCEISTLAGKVAEFEDSLRADAVFVDATGVGAGVVSNLRLMGRTPIAVMLGGASNSAECALKRDECWWLMKKWLADEQGQIPEDERLKDDLCAPDYGYDMRGRVKLERKQDMRARGLASPDYADALALTFAQPIRPRADELSERHELKPKHGLFEWGKG